MLSISMNIFRSWAPFGALGATYADHLRLIGNLVATYYFVLSQSTRLTDRRTAFSWLDRLQHSNKQSIGCDAQREAEEDWLEKF